ncbi:MAG TPA: hypothetical protein VFM38_11740 [Candidatus Limnocylindrales bacterium]|nr:hypothetical protein [Candidatus Limnocylindrales bacterium]
MPPPWRRLLLTVALALLMTACGSTAPTPTPSAAASDEPSTPGPTTTAAPSVAGGQTDTDWGPIWDTVPPSFPRFPGSTPADDAGGDAVSARSSVPGGEPQAIATWFRDALEERGFSTVGLNGPAEDGGFVLDAAGAGDCRIQTTVAPLGDLTFITVRYGAGCPAP